MRGIVTLDGPSASGKSSVAKRVAEVLGVPYLSSGLLYRAAALLALRAGVDPKDEAGLLRLLEARRVRLVPGRENRVLADGEDLTPFLHTLEVDRVVSEVARHPGVRAWVNERLKEVPPPFVAEGRDMGTAVFPEAPHKFYLTASPEVRARRRAKERPSDYEAVLRDLLVRDERDKAQSAPAPDALVLDTSGMTLDEVVAWVLAHLKD
ncbi:cytidylate kinase [Thermus scotoductus]|uniref:Cytidylate kinase n=1 Tax=Thermus scotoductus TaxID=37636 RepID=A0A430S9U9_THESC|nr:(d)CMP kinase [Thermus scotoductus]RTG95767.1 cytidylate kinase [Thermus scotoductus]RTH11017.1 cytidylate kinase [Thermus scotoductus]RTH12341.1 cytidylate kinase [Thermus scotoductus]RTH12516.1 cytidylate kinase [Thermus scotoductus]RTH17898.1 cytidylate kinase [Thermus scotoductus]